jgi:hypothetical protein
MICFPKTWTFSYVSLLLGELLVPEDKATTVLVRPSVVEHELDSDQIIGNTYQDAMALYRRTQGLKGTSIDLGVVLDVGFVAEHSTFSGYLSSGLLVALREQEVLALIQAAMADQVGTQAIVGMATGGMLKQGGYDEPAWFTESRFGPSRIYGTHEIASTRLDASEELDTALGLAKSLDDATDILCAALKQKLVRAMMLDAEDLDLNRPLNSYGVDSLVAVEIRAWVFNQARSEVSVFDILSNAPIVILARKIAARSALVSWEVRSEDHEV